MLVTHMPKLDSVMLVLSVGTMAPLVLALVLEHALKLISGTSRACMVDMGKAGVLNRCAFVCDKKKACRDMAVLSRCAEKAGRGLCCVTIAGQDNKYMEHI